MLSNASKYAVKAMLFLMLYANKNNKIGVKLLAHNLEIPEPFLAKLLQQLVRHKLLSSTKGPNGGFYISKKNELNNVCDILMAIDGHELFDNCFMELDKCHANNPCPVHFIVAEFKENLYKKFKEMNLKQFANDVEATSQFLNLKSKD